jgi:hypothetical protein
MAVIGDLEPTTRRRDRRSMLRSPPTRRETFLFGLLILALAWTVESGRAERRVVHVIPNFATPNITSTSTAAPDFNI